MNPTLEELRVMVSDPDIRPIAALQFQNAVDEIERLELRLAELKKDKQRLDWLLSNASIVFDANFMDTREEVDLTIEAQTYNNT